MSTCRLAYLAGLQCLNLRAVWKNSGLLFRYKQQPVTFNTSRVAAHSATCAHLCRLLHPSVTVLLVVLVIFTLLAGPVEANPFAVVEINMRPFNQEVPMMQNKQSIGQGVQFLNRFLSSSFFAGCVLSRCKMIGQDHHTRSHCLVFITHIWGIQTQPHSCLDSYAPVFC